MNNGGTLTARRGSGRNARDKHDDETKHLGRDISHLTPDKVEKYYEYRLSDTKKEEVHTLFKNSFAGTKKYHNYTREMRPEQTAS